MCRLGCAAGSVAEVSGVHCGISDFVDGSQRSDADRHTPASDAGDFVCCFGSSAARTVRGDANAS